MTASGPARLLAVLLLCTRLLAVAVAMAILVWVVRGEPIRIDHLRSIPRNIGAFVTTTSLTGTARAPASTTEARSAEAGPVDRAQLRHRLQQLFGHHTTLAVRFMRLTVSEDPDFVDVANAVLVRNTGELEAALEPSLSADQAAAFSVGLAGYTQVLFRYAAALRDEDTAAQEDARALLLSTVDEQSRLLADATDGAVDRDTAAASLRMQVDLLLFEIDAFARGDYGQAYELEREAYAHMVPFAATVAGGVTGHPHGTIHVTPEEELTAELARLLGAHVELTVDTLRAGTANAESSAASAALDANDQELSDTLDGLLDARSSERFAALWTEHIDLLMRYRAAVAKHQPSRQRELRDRLDTLAGKFGTTMRKAARGHADASVVTDALRSQQLLLLDQLDAYAAGDHATAHDISYRAHQRGYDLARTLGTAFIAAAEDSAPRGGADTGGGGAAGHRPAATHAGAGVTQFEPARAHAPAPAPVRIEIPSIDVRGDLTRLDRAADGTIAPPPRWQTAGWYRHSARPGQQGAAVILGHVDSTTGPAVFYRLRQLGIGDQIRIVRADGSTVRFVVRRTAHYPKTQFPTADVYLPTPEPTLRLVTCGGTFDRAAASYRENLVVFADLIE
jgi:sortase (surface protein transpeptidase)